MAKPFPQLEFLFTPRKQKPENLHKKTTKHPDAELTTWCKTTAEALHLPKIASQVTVSWNPRMRTAAGRAWWPTCLIELNPRLQEISQEEIHRTLKHELAHLIAYQRAGRKKIQPHGTEWKQACSDLGIPGESTRHTLPFTSHRQTRRYSYACPACGKSIERVRPFSRPVACHPCCKKENGGHFHETFKLVQKKL